MVAIGVWANRVVVPRIVITETSKTRRATPRAIYSACLSRRCGFAVDVFQSGYNRAGASNGRRKIADNRPIDKANRILTRWAKESMDFKHGVFTTSHNCREA